MTLRLSNRVNESIKKSSLIYAFSAEDQALFKNEGAQRVEVMLDAGCGLQVSSYPQPATGIFQPATSTRVRILWCGQLIKRKALDILLKAVAGDDDLKDHVEITIVGDGPLRKKYETLITKLFPSITTNPNSTSTTKLVRMTGWITRDEVFAHMRGSDILVHTSYREATSNVIAEALSCGLPVICHDISGMSIAITDDCGIKIPLKSYNNSILAFRSALKLITHNSQLTTLSNYHSQTLPAFRSAALRRAHELSWDAMAERISADYNLICGKL
jgi:glycosyltransferase involved in cell wall biosynthesis